MSISFDDLQSKVIDLPDFSSAGRFSHCGIRFSFRNILKIQVEFEQAFGTVDVLNASLPRGESFYLKPQVIMNLDDSGRLLQATRMFPLFVRPSPGSLGQFEPRVYKPGHCGKITISKIGYVKRNPAVEYALYLLEVAKEMMDDAESAMAQNRFGLAVHFSRYSIEFSAKSIIVTAGKQWPKNEHDVSDVLRRKDVSDTFKASMSIEEIAWDMNLWSSPQRVDLYGNPGSFTEPFAIMPLEEVQMIMGRAEKISNAALENYERNHLVKV